MLQELGLLGLTCFTWSTELNTITLHACPVKLIPKRIVQLPAMTMCVLVYIMHDTPSLRDRWDNTPLSFARNQQLVCFYTQELGSMQHSLMDFTLCWYLSFEHICHQG